MTLPDPNPTLRVELVDRLEGLDALAAEWDRLAAATPPDRPMLTHAWVRTHLEHRLPPRSKWRCAFAFEGEELVGVLPMIIQGPSFARRLHSVVDEHCSSGDAVVPAERVYDILPRLTRAHRQAEPHAVSMTLHGVVDGSPSFLVRPADVLATEVMQGATLDVDRSFEDCLAELSGNTRNKLRRATRALEKEGELVAEFLDGNAEGALERFCELEAAGWKGRAGTAIAMDEALMAYYRDLTRRLAERDWLRWHFLRLGDKTIAAEMVVELGATISVQKVAFDEAYAKHSPGNLIWARTVEWACEQPDIVCVDVLADDQLMQRWGARAYAYLDLTRMARGWRARLFAVWPRKIRSAIKKLLRRGEAE